MKNFGGNEMLEKREIKEIMEMNHVLSYYKTGSGPAIVNLSLLSFIGCKGCNGIYCPVWREGKRDSNLKHSMDIETLKLVVDGISKFPGSPVLRLLPHGELAMFPDLTKVAKILTPLFPITPLVANTNGVNLMNLEPLLPILTVLEVSLNAINSDQYKELRPAADQGDFERISNDIRYIAQRVKKDELKLKLVVSFLRYPKINDDDSWIEFKKNWSEIELEPILREYHSFSGMRPSPPNRQIGTLPPCKSIFTRMTIDSRGYAIRCYNDILSSDRIGKITKNNSLSDIWYSNENLKGMMKMLNGNKSTYKIFCDNCRDRVCVDPHQKIGVGKPFEEHAWAHFKNI